MKRHLDGLSLQCFFKEPEVNLTLELFLRMVREQLAERLVSVVLYGSICWDDLAPGYGDLDFLAVVQDDLSADDRERLVKMRMPLRGGNLGIYAHMLEGAFLPRRMLDPSRPGKALWWGTSGERSWDANSLGWLVLHVIRERGIVISGEDISGEIPPAQRSDLLDDVQQACRDMNEHGRGGTLHSIDWLLTAARLLLWLREGRLTSKTEAAEWGAVCAGGDWRKFLPRASQMRRSPELAGEPEGAEWLAGLAEPIRQAQEELEQLLSECRRSCPTA